MRYTDLNEQHINYLPSKINVRYPNPSVLGVEKEGREFKALGTRKRKGVK